MAHVVTEMLDFYRGKKVFVTGSTGFKGSWLCCVLTMAGAEVTGYALPPTGDESLWKLTGLEAGIHQIYGDIRDLDRLWDALQAAQPDIVFHLAAQPIVRESYRDPVGTYSTNVMGTVYILECIRRSESVRSVLNVTTDKVYQNEQWPWGYRETDRLNGFDPYSNSKSCSELITDSYRKSFLTEKGLAVSTARAGNVIGGGDFSADRIIPDCVRAARKGDTIQLRNPYSVRPYQYVLDPISAYLLIAARQWEDVSLSGAYNIGPNNEGCVTTGQLADIFCGEWGDGLCWKQVGEAGPHEDAVLKLDNAKIRQVLGWQPKYNVRDAVKAAVDWTKAWLKGQNIAEFMQRQIESYLGRVPARRPNSL